MAKTKKVPAARAARATEEERDNFGPALRKARRIRHLTLDELATSVDCSASALSKIESQTAAPSFRMLVRICQALHMDVATLLQSRTAARALVTKANRHPVFHATGMEFLMLLPSSAEHRMEVSITEIAPGVHSGEPVAHGAGEEVGYVLEGKFLLTVDGKKYHLEAGDSFAFAYNRPHSFGNPSKRPTRVLFAFAPPVDFATRSRGGKRR